ncbi:MAG TPA: PKD domain-containing protein, partial [Saprospiraceae bacterium]|nr:PKD domain-containing protein [Saprospiraceae bacterium]
MKIGTLIIVFLWQLTAFGQNYLMNGNPIKDCGGYFLDSGGNAQNYGPNENFQSLICPDSTTGTHVELSFAGVDLLAGDELCFFDSTDISASSFLGCASDFAAAVPFKVQATAANPSGCLTVLFTSDATGQAKGWSATINCIPSCQLIQSELLSSVPAADPIDGGWIDICKGDRVDFSGRAIFAQNNLIYPQSELTSEFVWDFGDGSLGYGPNASHVYNQSGGFTVQLSITDQFGCTNTNFISQRVRISPRPSFNITDDIPSQICVGDTISISSAVLPGTAQVTAQPNEALFTVERFRADSLPLPDGDGRVHSTKITINDFAPGQVLTNVNDLLGICINMEHSWMHDLEVNITCPSGKRVILQNQEEIIHEVYLGTPFHDDEGFEPPIVGQGAEYCFTPTAINGTWTAFANDNVPSKTSLPAGDYNSFENLDELVGCPLNGDWTITVIDYWRDDNGWIFSWGLSFDPDIYPNVESFTPPLVNHGWMDNPTIFSNTPDLISAAPQNAGMTNYVFQVTDDFACQFDPSVNILVLPPTHPDCYNCKELTTNLQDTSVCEGESIQLNTAAPEQIEQAITFESFPNYQFSKNNHPTTKPFETSIAVNSIFPTMITNPTLDIASICMDIETSGWVSDLRIALRAPSGELLLLTDANGGQNKNYTSTCFSPTATNLITSATAPFTGSFLPQGNFSVLNGATINGDWTLIVSDCCGNIDFNILKSWTITFNNKNNISYTWSNPTGLSCTDCPDPTASPMEDQTYLLTLEDSYACQAEDSLHIRVLNEFSAPEVSLLTMENGNITFIWTRIPDAPTYEV